MTMKNSDKKYCLSFPLNKTGAIFVKENYTYYKMKYFITRNPIQQCFV